jgi:hypothetical protein
VLVVVGGGALLALVVEGAEIGGLVESRIGPLLILPIGGDCMTELVTVGLDAITVGFEGRTVEALLVMGISIDVVEVAIAILVVGSSVDVAISELATGLIVE